MSTFLARHQAKLIGVAIFLGVAGLIWLDEQRPHVPAGQPAPAVTLQMLDGSPAVTLESLKGKPVVLDFWATWCSPCRASLPHIDEVAKKYKGRAHVIAVNAESEEVALQTRARDELKLTMPIATNGVLAAAAYHIDRLPTTVVLNREGKVVNSFVGSVSNSKLEQILDEL